MDGEIFCSESLRDDAKTVSQKDSGHQDSRCRKSVALKGVQIALIAFLVPATLMGHAFWQAAGTPAYIPQLLNFLKNTSMTGGLLFVAATSNQFGLFPRTRDQAPVNEHICD